MPEIGSSTVTNKSAAAGAVTAFSAITVTAGDAIVLWGAIYDGSASGTISDSVNGTWSNMSFAYNATSNQAVAGAYLLNSAAGSIVVTLTLDISRALTISVAAIRKARVLNRAIVFESMTSAGTSHDGYSTGLNLNPNSMVFLAAAHDVAPGTSTVPNYTIRQNSGASIRGMMAYRNTVDRINGETGAYTTVDPAMDQTMMFALMADGDSFVSAHPQRNIRTSGRVRV